MCGMGLPGKQELQDKKELTTQNSCSPLSCPPNQPQNALREHQLALSGYNALLCNALLWASTKYDHSCIILHAMRHLSVGSIRNQVSLARLCWSWKRRQRTSLNGSRPCSRAWKAGLCILQNGFTSLQQNAVKLSYGTNQAGALGS